MDKYEYKLKTEEMLELMEDGEYRKAAAAADLIDWKRVRNAGMLMNVSDIYEKTKEYQKSYDVMNLAYRRSEGSRKVIYKLCSLAIKTKNIDEAIDYYDEFIQIAPKDPNRHILRYQILRAQRAPIEQQIEALEEFKKAEYIEEWAYELAKLYREAGMMTVKINLKALRCALEAAGYIECRIPDRDFLNSMYPPCFVMPSYRCLQPVRPS